MTVPEQASSSAAAGSSPESSGVVLSSRVRLARNLRGVPFPDSASSAARAEVRRQVMEAAREELPIQEDLAAATLLFRQRLFEEHLISRAMLEERPESGVCMDEARQRAVMINEEDHLRIQVLRSGLSLPEVWRLADALDDVLERHLDYAFSSTLGYLTSCPTNVGTGMRASALMHLPGLVLMNEIEPIIRGLAKIGLAVRGRWGEGTAALGHVFQVSNQITLGLSEERLIGDLEQIVMELVHHEDNARERLLRERTVFMQDLAARAEGVLLSARLMTTQEALERLSELRLGLALGLVRTSDIPTVDRLLLEIQPAHLQTLAGRCLDSQERDIARADRLRSVLSRRPTRLKTKRTP